MNSYFLFAVNGLLAWSIRGQFGGWSGAFVAGILLGSFLKPPNRAGILIGAVLFMWGGEISYGREFETLSLSLPNFQSGCVAIIKLLLFGAAWGGIGGFGLGYCFKPKILKRDWLLLSLMVATWAATIYFGWGHLIWLSFLATLAVALLITKNDDSFRSPQLFCLVLMCATALGFCLSGIFLLLSQIIEVEMIREILKLRDQIIGAAVGIGTLIANRRMSNTGYISRADIGYLIFAGFMAALAIAKEAIPGWPHKWEWSYTLMIVALIIMGITSRKQAA